MSSPPAKMLKVRRPGPKRLVNFVKINGKWQNIREYTRKRYRNNWSHNQVVAKRSLSKRKDLPFDLDESDLIIPEFCPVLGIPIFFEDGNGPKSHSPSIDRLIPSKGYVKGNIHVISRKANRIKNDATLDELEKVYKWLKNKLS